MTPETALPVRGAAPDPLNALQQMSLAGPGPGLAAAGGPPDADDLAKGVQDSLRTILALAITSARTVPAIADEMRNIRQASMQAMLKVQNVGLGGNEAGSVPSASTMGIGTGGGY